MPVLVRVAHQPVHVAHRRRGAGDPQVLVLGDAGDRDVSLVGSAVVEHGGVHKPTDRHRDIVGTHELQEPLRVPPLDQQLAEGGLVEDGHGLAGGALLRIDPGNPILLAPVVVDCRLLPRGCEEDRALPAETRAEGGVALLHAIVQR